MSLTTQHSGASALVPRNISEAMEMARMMASTGFLAKELQNPGGAMFVMEQAMRWSMSPFAVAMETSFIQGKPMFSGKIVAAAVVSSGAIIGRLAYAYEGQGDNRVITVSGTARGETEPRTVTVRLGDAKTSNKVWQTQPDQQLAYHGARVWARRHTPEVMLGVYSEEEMDVPQRPMQPAAGPTIQGEARAAPPAPEFVLLAPDGTERIMSTPAKWQSRCIEAVAKIGPDGISDWWRAMAQHIEAMSAAGHHDEVEAVTNSAMRQMQAGANVVSEGKGE